MKSSPASADTTHRAWAESCESGKATPVIRRCAVRAGARRFQHACPQRLDDGACRRNLSALGKKRAIWKRYFFPSIFVRWGFADMRAGAALKTSKHRPFGTFFAMPPVPPRRPTRRQFRATYAQRKRTRAPAAPFLCTTSRARRLLLPRRALLPTRALSPRGSLPHDPVSLDRCGRRER